LIINAWTFQPGWLYISYVIILIFALYLCYILISRFSAFVYMFISWNSIFNFHLKTTFWYYNFSLFTLIWTYSWDFLLDWKIIFFSLKVVNDDIWCCGRQKRREKKPCWQWNIMNHTRCGTFAYLHSLLYPFFISKSLIE
jgi:hypothetical protein